MNNSISNKSPSLYENNSTLFDLSGNHASTFEGNMQKQLQSAPQEYIGHTKHVSNMIAPNM